MVDGRRVNACLTLAVMNEGRQITTVEGLASGDPDNARLAPLQAAFIEYDAFQCGFCTPGQLCSATAVLREMKEGRVSAATPDVRALKVAYSDDEIRERMSGNICRCGAYPEHRARDAQRRRRSERGAARSTRPVRRSPSIRRARRRSPEESPCRHSATNARPTSLPRSRSGQQAGARYIGGRHQPARPHEGRRREADEADRHHAAAADRYRHDFRWRRRDRRASPQQRPSPIIRPFARAIRSSAKRWWPVRRDSCATWPRSAATCCSARAATTSSTPRSRCATSACRDRAAARSKGHNRIHAIYGASDACIATNPSDMNVALAALDASVRVAGPRGERRIAFADFHRLPGSTPERDTTLEPGELITAVELPPVAPGATLDLPEGCATARATRSRWSRSRRPSRSWTARSSMPASRWAGVAHKPWRAREVEAALVGQPATSRQHRCRVGAGRSRCPTLQGQPLQGAARATDGGAGRWPQPRRASESARSIGCTIGCTIGCNTFIQDSSKARHGTPPFPPLPMP